MGTYFTNETLDGLWTRLVNATKALYETAGDGSYIEEVDDGTGNIYQEYYCGTCGAVNGLSEIPCSNCGSIPDFGRTLESTGIKGIHDALLSYYDLSHENTPTMPGDYMKGIAVAARYKEFGLTELEPLWSLEQIIDSLEQTSKQYTIYLDGDIVKSRGWDPLGETQYVSAYAYISSNNVQEFVSVMLRNDVDTELFDITSYLGSAEIGEQVKISLYEGDNPIDYDQISNVITYTYQGSDPGPSPEPSLSISDFDVYKEGSTYKLYASIADPEEFSPTWEIEVCDSGGTILDSKTYEDTIFTVDLTDIYDQFVEDRIYIINGQVYTDNEEDSREVSFVWNLEESSDPSLDVSTLVTYETLTDNIRFTVTHTGNSELIVEAYEIELFDKEANLVVASEALDGNQVNVAKTFMATDIYTDYIMDRAYIMTVAAVKNSEAPPEYWSSDSVEFTWSFETEDEPVDSLSIDLEIRNGNVAYVTPSATGDIDNSYINGATVTLIHPASSSTFGPVAITVACDVATIFNIVDTFPSVEFDEELNPYRLRVVVDMQEGIEDAVAEQEFNYTMDPENPPEEEDYYNGEPIVSYNWGLNKIYVENYQSDNYEITYNAYNTNGDYTGTASLTGILQDNYTEEFIYESWQMTDIKIRIMYHFDGENEYWTDYATVSFD